MSGNLVTFNICFEKNQRKIKIPTPVNISEFNKQLKSRLEIDDSEEIVILCPLLEGKMMNIKTDDDIELLKKFKIWYNSMTKEIYCSVELVVIVVQNKLSEDPKIQIMALSNKIDLLASQFTNTSLLFNKTFEENILKIQNNINESMKSILLENLQTDVCNKIKSISLDKQSTNSFYPERKPPQKQKCKPMVEKLIMPDYMAMDYNTSSNYSRKSNQLEESVPYSPTKNLDSSLEVLEKEGFKNTIQNIIVLKRFKNDCEKAINYLRISS